jgi:hypothetical protein
MSVPQYWMADTGGALRQAVMDYLSGAPLDGRQMAVMRAYLRQWMAADWRGPMIDPLRTQVEELLTRDDVTRWCDRAQTADIDPF